MGIGDWIIATAEAREFNEETGRPVVFAHPKHNTPLWSEVFGNNPRILKRPQRGQDVVVVRNHGGSRPYHLGYDGEKKRFTWNYKFRYRPGELYLSHSEKASGIDGAVIVEPHTKNFPLSRNKAWPWERWQELVKSLDLPWVQLGPADAKTLEGVRRVVTHAFRDCLGHINRAALIVTTDGALHHAAAALGKPAIVLWGGLAPPSLLGWEGHVNICHATDWCGSNYDCPHCRKAMESITVDEVRAAIIRDRAIQNLAQKEPVVQGHGD